MKITITLFGLVMTIVIAALLCFFFCNIEQSVYGYDFLIYSKNENPKRHLGIRYKDDFMIHVFERETVTVGTGVDRLVDLWKKRQQEKEAQDVEE
jgi:hypothetical protein